VPGPSGGRLHFGMVAGNQSERWPTQIGIPGRIASEFARGDYGPKRSGTGITVKQACSRPTKSAASTNSSSALARTESKSFEAFERSFFEKKGAPEPFAS